MNFILPFFLVLHCQFFFYIVSFHYLKKKSLGRIVSLLFGIVLSFSQGCMFKWNRNTTGRLVRISIPQGAYSESSLNLDQMEPPQEEQQSQQGVERNLNAYRSMRDYMHPPWVSAPSCMVPPTDAPYNSTYNPSWGNHLNFSRKPRPPQYGFPAHPQYPSTPQPPQPPQLTSSVKQAILSLSKLVGTFIEEEKAVNV